jgi:hypothetical protein
MWIAMGSLQGMYQEWEAPCFPMDILKYHCYKHRHQLLFSTSVQSVTGASASAVGTITVIADTSLPSSWINNNVTGISKEKKCHAQTVGAPW